VWALVNVKLMEEFLGNCKPCLPQYFTMAILEGDFHPALPDVLPFALLNIREELLKLSMIMFNEFKTAQRYSKGGYVKQ
jgi:hypothetical protein